MMKAEDWHIPPWLVEDAPAIWHDRWWADRMARQDAESPRMVTPPGAGTVSGSGVRRTKIL